MIYSEAIIHAISGKTLMLPGWHGYFYWNYSTNDLNFKDGDYRLNNKQLLDLDIDKRTDWYYII